MPMDHHRHNHDQRHHNPEFMDSRYHFPVRPAPPPPHHPFRADPNPNLHHHRPPPPPPAHHRTSYHHPPPRHHLPPPQHHHPPQIVHQPPPLPPPPSLPYHHHHHHERNFDFPPSPRVPSNQGFVYDHNHHHRDDDRHRVYLPEPPPPPPMVSPLASMAPPPISSCGFDMHHEASVHRPIDFREIDEFRSPNRFGDDLEAAHRLRLRPDELGEWRGDRRIMDDVERGRLEDHRFHDPYHPEMLPREFDLNLGVSDCTRDEVLIEDREIGMMMDDDLNIKYDVQGSSREVSCSSIKFRNRGSNRDDGFREFYEEEMNRGSESGRYHDRGRRQEMQDYSRSPNPRKNLRKKSAFLRIQPLKHSNFRNRHDTTPSPHKGKESLELLGDRSSDQRDGSNVELDVSFKSNSLVAKAIMAGPLSSGVDTNENSSLNDLDVRVDGKTPSKAEGNGNCGDNSSVSRKVGKHSENRVRISPTLKRVGLSSDVDVCHNNTESPSSGSSSLNGGTTHRGSPKGEISDKNDTNPYPGKVSSPNIRKKRKSNILLSRLSSSPSKTNANPVNEINLADHPSGSSVSDVSIKQAEKESLSLGLVVGSTQNETIIGIEKTNANGSPIVVVEAVGCTVSEARLQKRMRNKGISKSPFDTSGPLGPSISGASGKLDRCADDMQKVSNADENVTKSVDICASDSTTEGDNHGSPVILAGLVDNGSVEGSSEALISLGCNVDHADIFSDDLEKRGALDVSNSILNTHSAPVKIQDGVDITCVVVNDDRPCTTIVTSSNDVIGQSRGEELFDADDSYTHEMENHGFLLISSNLDISSDKTSASFSHDDVALDSEKLTATSGLKATDDIQGQQCGGEGNVSVGGVDGEGPSNAIISMEGDTTFFSAEDTPGPVLNRKRKSRNELQYINSGISEPSYDATETKIFQMMNSSLPVEERGSTVLGLPCCSAEPDIPLQRGLKDSCPESIINSPNHGQDSDASECPSQHSKKIKILSFGSFPSDASTSQKCDLPAPGSSSISITEIRLNSTEYLAKPAEGIEVPNIALPEKNAVERASSSLQTRYSIPDSSNSDLFKGDQRLSVNEIAPLKEKWSSHLSCKEEGNVNLVMSGTTGESESAALQSEGRMTTNYGIVGLHCMEIDEIGNSSHGSLVMDVVCEDSIAVNGNLPSESDCLQIHAECIKDAANTDDCIGVFGHEPVVMDVISGDNLALNGSLPQLHAEYTADGAAIDLDMVGLQPNESSPEADSLPSHSLQSDSVTAVTFSSDRNLSWDAKKSNQRLVTQSYLSSQSKSLVKSNTTNSKPGISATAAAAKQPFAQKNVVFAKNAMNASRANPMSRQPIRRNVLIRGDVSSSRASSVTTPPNKALPTYPVKPRTWRRTDNLAASNTVVKKPSLGTAPPQRPPIDKTIKVQSTSYVRKGNSLVRNPASGAVTMGPGVFGVTINQSKPNAANNTSKIAVPSEMIGYTVVSDHLMTGGRNSHVEMPRTPPLPCSGMASDHEIGQSSPQRGQSEGIDEATKSSETAPSSCRNPETDMDRCLEDPATLSDGNSPASESKRVVYIKRKSNQLIAASNPSKPSIHKMNNASAFSSDNGYFKRRKNQLIRASSEGNIQHLVSKMDDISNSQPQKTHSFYSGRNSTKRQSTKGKPPKVSLVWKLGDAKSSVKGIDPLRRGKILSHLLPWKRATYWRSVWQSSINFSSNSSLLITRKLLSPRKRAAVYVRSGRGFSLRRSKVISLAGYSLKWSKSMEKRSKKVDEEAAWATVKMDSVERPKSGASGERIYRIGMFRYRMDPSRRTLQRIADEVSSDLAALKSEHGARKTYLPKRLLIGSNEYVRIGNGNQLVRDPKRRTRLLASEKVRWSLHTARMRLAKKRKFCQFFTRFGKCNKVEGKCPYIHDPSKIAVCTKFLNGLCGDPSCKLTHKVIPERMPDCSFFLQGSCSNENCPYRHVNVNPKAPICENFLRGYCAEGNECLKKHSYICPEFEATGSCPQGSRCKLYHPKKGKGKKRKTSKDRRNSRGRYFGSGPATTSEPEIGLAEKLSARKNGLEDTQGELGDFISFDVSDDEVGEYDYEDPTAEPMSSLPDSQVVNSELEDLEELIMPLRILNRH